MTTHVLVADDDFELRAAVVRSLTAEGMSVEQASSGSEVLSRLADGNVDLLVTDVIMPDLGGVQAAAMVRTAGVELPILVMTGRRDPWIVEAVRKLQCADLLYKPFSSDELIEHTRALLARHDTLPIAAVPRSEPHVFPPALVPLLRAGVGESDLLASVPDQDLRELLSIVFFAGLETEEGERNPLRVVLTSSPADAEPPTAGVPPALFRWSTLRFKTERPLSVNLLVKLAAAMTNGREYVQVSRRDGRLVVTGLAREGVNLENDTALKIVVDRPGGLSLRIGRHHVLDYEHGRVQSLATSSVILSSGPIRAAFEHTATRCGLPTTGTGRYLDAVRMLVAKLSAHGAGGILVFESDVSVEAPGSLGYKTYSDISLAAMLTRLHHLQSDGSPREREQNQLLAGALQAEIHHTILELGGLTALDGATLLDGSLALVGFGIVLPVSEPTPMVLEAQDLHTDTTTHPFDLGGRGTRHRAAATYAASHPKSVVFVASQDGDLGCLLCGPHAPAVTLWRFRAADLHS